MTLTISLSPKLEDALATEASAAGVPVSRFVETLIERELGAAGTGPRNQDEISAHMAALRALSSQVKSVKDPNFTRETIYQDHD